MGRSAWWRAFVAGHLHDAGERLRHGVVAGHRPTDRTRTERIDVVADHVRISGAHGRCADADPIGDARSHGLQHDRRGSGQRERDLDALRVLQVDDDAALADRHVAMDDAAIADVRRPEARVVAFGRFDLDDVRAELREDHRRDGSRDARRELDDPHAVASARKTSS